MALRVRLFQGGGMSKVVLHMSCRRHGHGAATAQERLPPEHVELDLVRALDGPGVQHLRYRVTTKG
jgi:hypothetical protein